jgi:hypothetical protein
MPVGLSRIMLTLNVNVAIPVYQNVSSSAEQNYTVSAGLSIKF